METISIKTDETRPNEFGSMTARKDHIDRRDVAIKRPYNTIKDNTKTM